MKNKIVFSDHSTLVGGNTKGRKNRLETLLRMMPGSIVYVSPEKIEEIKHPSIDWEDIRVHGREYGPFPIITIEGIEDSVYHTFFSLESNSENCLFLPDRGMRKVKPTDAGFEYIPNGRKYNFRLVQGELLKPPF